jgi:hypothetical protein
MSFLLSFERDQREESRCVRIRILLLVEVNVIEVHDEHCILRDVHPVVYKVFGRKVRRWYPKWRVRAQHLGRETTCEKRELETKVPGIAAHLLDDGPDVWETLLILCTWPIVSADHLVKFCMSACLDFWM